MSIPHCYSLSRYCIHCQTRLVSLTQTYSVPSHCLNYLEINVCKHNTVWGMRLHSQFAFLIFNSIAIHSTSTIV